LHPLLWQIFPNPHATPPLHVQLPLLQAFPCATLHVAVPHTHWSSTVALVLTLHVAPATHAKSPKHASVPAAVHW
jgi:hypothetical protein